MISRIEGELVEVDDGRAHVRCGGMVYEVLIPAADYGSMMNTAPFRVPVQL